LLDGFPLELYDGHADAMNEMWVCNVLKALEEELPEKRVVVLVSADLWVVLVYP
jgi:hypothetical protein